VVRKVTLTVGRFGKRRLEKKVGGGRGACVQKGFFFPRVGGLELLNIYLFGCWRCRGHMDLSQILYIGLGSCFRV